MGFAQCEVIDFGCGKGYLSALLTLRHSINVIGLESNESTVSSAMSRFRKISKQWPVLKKRLTAPEYVVKETPGTFCVLPCTVRRDLNSDSYLEKPETYLLCGLHTCGSLGNDIAEVFVQNERNLGLCFVGCCYHYMEEEFDRRQPCDGHSMFPLSAYLRRKQFFFGKNTRMLASQSVDRTLREGRKRLDVSARSLFFRALLQILLVRSILPDKTDNLERCDPDEVRVGRIPVDLQTSFSEYAEKAGKICGFPAAVLGPECEEVFQQFKSVEVHMKIVNLLRIVLGACVEQVMLLDRLCYLEEQEGIAEVGLIAMFDPVVSPRSWAICARKLQQPVQQS
ncbi:hypothetical protein RvY_08876-2 [Ramazzottius varieornatus]|uniref:Methyltransferase domain-containing protein n=1 Tax=Ramazzottius varieornatus TaxID=947166 RepID=A0A1D1V7F8_RAMVA|nr:hypothetical protein RvY_08876-2 [Ramazzottius varieornatus]